MVVLVLLLPAVKVAAVPPFKTVPVPESEPIVLLNPFKSRVEFTVKAEFGLNAVVDAAWNVPAMSVVAPLYVLLEDTVIMPAPVMSTITDPDPVISWTRG